jgi:high affinity Mn2+ porin
MGRLQNLFVTSVLQGFVAVVSVISFTGVMKAQQSPTTQAPQNPPPEGGQIPRQEENKKPAPEIVNERWNLFWQATSIGQYHGTFRAPYEGTNSLENRTERDVSLTSTLYLGFRPFKNTQIYLNGELAGGRGFSGVTGLANFSNGELPRVASATPKPYLARAYIQQDFGFGSEKETFEDEENQLAGTRPLKRYTLIVGRFSAEDFFDNNSYSHDPRTQFMGWSTMYNGAFDYPADTRGYTWGWVHELHLKNWSFRYGGLGEPKVANGQHFDRRVLQNRGDVFEVERRYAPGQHRGIIRLLGFALHTDSGTYADAIRLGEETNATPDITLTRRSGTTKYGFGINAEQAITRDTGVFTRLGWNDGKTESFAFTAIDRLASGGVSTVGRRWRRSNDTAATALSVGGISGVHAQYLAKGGLDFLIGDGRLNYGPEYIWETYYSACLFPGFFATFNLQRVANPAYNQDRGPVWISSVRFHIEVGKQTFSQKTR